MTELLHIPLDDVRESPSNLRTYFDPVKLDELAQSIREHGVRQPIEVRPKDGVYEIVFGARRHRASRIADQPTIPALVNDLTDKQALVIQLIENLQDEGLHPMQEAVGYKRLIEYEDFTIDVVATQVGKSVSYIYQRLKLADLGKQAGKAFLEDKITAGHAILIARLQENLQRQVLEYATGYRRPSVRELGDWIRTSLLVKLSAAPFKQTDPDLSPAAGACKVCPKRTGAQPDLFEDYGSRDMCMDRKCYDRKVDAHIKLQVKGYKVNDVSLVKVTEQYYGDTREATLHRGQWEPAKGKDKTAEPAIIVSGERRGHVISITRSRMRERARATRAPVMESLPERRVRAKSIAGEQAISAIVDKVKKLTAPADLRLVASAFVGDIWHEHHKAICRSRGWDVKKHRFNKNAKDYLGTIEREVAKMKADELAGLIVECALRGRGGRTDNRAPLPSIARRYRVNLPNMEKAVMAELNEKAKRRKSNKKKKAKRLQPSAKPKGGRGMIKDKAAA